VFSRDHLHAIWTLPEDDADFPMRWNLVKSGFSRALPASDARSPSLASKREKGLWQRRYWEHVIRDDRDMERHINYIHYNPVKHGLTTCVADWPHSSFHRYVKCCDLPLDWGGDMREICGRFGVKVVGTALREAEDVEARCVAPLPTLRWSRKHPR
jgi:putative transposase